LLGVGWVVGFVQDINSSNQYETGIALNALANICTPDLAQDLAADVLALLSSSKPYVRKKAILCLYKIFLKFPQALRPSYPRLREKLEDADLCMSLYQLHSLSRSYELVACYSLTLSLSLHYSRDFIVGQCHL
jgi:hypothetical protein